MILFQTDDLIVSLFKIEQNIGNNILLPAYDPKKKQRTDSLFGRAAAAELFSLYYHEKFSEDPDNERISALKIEVGEYGKPFLPEHPDFRFNISHSGDYAVAVWCRTGDVGIDIEKIRPYPEKVAERCFSPEELAALHAASKTEKDELFFRIWTRKEALVKLFGQSIFADSLPNTEQVFFAEKMNCPNGYCITIATKK